MAEVSLKLLKNSTEYKKNILYKIDKSTIVPFEEKHENSKEVVNLEYCLKEQQYGIFAHEYRSPVAFKEGSKSADVLACVVDEEGKEIYTIIFDVKSNISAFSDDLTKDNAMLTAIKEVRDFTEQIHDGILHKNSFMLYYKDKGYIEQETVGVVTKNFEEKKFAAVAERLEQLSEKENLQVPKLVSLKVKNNLQSYGNEIGRMRNFANRMVEISGKIYKLQVFLLDKISDSEYRKSIKIASNNI